MICLCFVPTLEIDKMSFFHMIQYSETVTGTFPGAKVPYMEL